MSNFKYVFSKSNVLIGIFILMLGIFAGIMLISQSQDIRNRAKEKTEVKISICEKDTSSGKWQQIEVSEDELKEHINQGSILGACPEEIMGKNWEK